MTGLIAILIVALLAVVAVQLGKVSELATKIRGEEAAERQSNDRTAVWLVIFMIAMLVLGIGSAYYYKNLMLGYGPMIPASLHGWEVDSLFNITLFFTGIVFVLTQVLLFWYPYKYRKQKGKKAKFISHNNTLELVWTVIPSIVLTFLVVKGLVAWNKIMPDLSPDQEVVNIEATGYQFAWDIRYAGDDGTLGEKDFRLIDMASNTLGVDWEDENSIDDIILSGSDNIVLPVDTTVRVKITSKDVLHNFYLPQFRVKMDAIPGLPTYFIFEPTMTTKEYRQQLKEYPEWNEPYDEEDPESLPRWKEFNFELACAELCGKGHYSMRRVVEIVTKEEYEEWLSGKTSYYMNIVRNTEADPRKGQLLDIEIKKRAEVLKTDFSDALSGEDVIVKLDHVFYATGSAELNDLSNYELTNLAAIMKANPDSKIELRGHTDSAGDDTANIALSQRRADNVRSFLQRKGINAQRLVSKGYGETIALESNDTDEGRAANRRTELRIISK